MIKERQIVMRRYAFGVDIGGTTVKIGLFETSGILSDKWEIQTRTSESGRYILEDIADAIRNKCKEKQIAQDEIQGIGIGVSGPVFEGTIVNKCVNLGWGVINVVEIMERLTGIKNIVVGNDANVAALGEMWKGAGEGHKNVVMITLGTGVGGGIVIDGKIVSGRFGAAGEIGHIQVEKEEKRFCGCGKHGHLEQYASATGIVWKTTELLKTTTESSMLRKIDEITAKAVFDAAKTGDSLALKVVQFVGEKMGQALSYISCIIDPEVFVIGGGVSKAGSILVDEIRKYYKGATFHASEKTDIVLAMCGNDAGMYGAVKMVLN